MFHGQNSSLSYAHKNVKDFLKPNLNGLIDPQIFVFKSLLFSLSTISIQKVQKLE